VFLCFDVGSAGGDNVHDNWLNFMRSPTWLTEDRMPSFVGIDLKNGVFKAEGKEDNDLMTSFLRNQGIDLPAIESLISLTHGY
jgi:hypothetical protein